MTLELIHGNERHGLSLGVLPLGPWAGAEVVVWASKTGKVWHGDEACSRHISRTRHETHQQPERGTLGDLSLPDELHCKPPGDLSSYWDAANRLVQFAAATDDSRRRLRDGDLTLDILPSQDARGGMLNAWTEVEHSALRDHWLSERAQREELLRELVMQLHSEDERLATMVLASWIRAGRTSREHQARYTRFLDVGIEELRSRKISSTLGLRGTVNQVERLPGWLDDIVDGMSSINATSALAAREYRSAQLGHESEPEFADSVRGAWAAAGRRWQEMLEAMALSHPGAVLALVHRYAPGIDRTLLDTCLDIDGGAQLIVGSLDWVVAVVPAAFRVILAERDSGLNGLVLVDELPDRADSQVCARILRNLITSLGCPELADSVIARGSLLRGDMGTVVTTANAADLDGGRDVRLHWQQQGFGTGMSDSGVTVGDCMPALVAALEGRELGSPQPPRRSTRKN